MYIDDKCYKAFDETKLPVYELIVTKLLQDSFKDELKNENNETEKTNVLLSKNEIRSYLHNLLKD